MQAFGEVYDVSGTSFIKTCIEMTTSVKSLKYHDRKLPLIPSSFHRFFARCVLGYAQHVRVEVDIVRGVGFKAESKATYCEMMLHSCSCYTICYAVTC